MKRLGHFLDYLLTGQRYLSAVGIFITVLALSILLGEFIYNRWTLVFSFIYIFLVVTVFFLGLIILSYLRYGERRHGLKQMLSWIASAVMGMNAAALIDTPNAQYGQFLVSFGGAIVLLIVFAYVARHHPRDAFTVFLFGKPEDYSSKNSSKH